MSPLFSMLGAVEIGVIALVILLLFGNRLPTLARSFGKSIVEFKKGVNGSDSDAETGTLPPKP